MLFHSKILLYASIAAVFLSISTIDVYSNPLGVDYIKRLFTRTKVPPAVQPPSFNDETPLPTHGKVNVETLNTEKSLPKLPVEKVELSNKPLPKLPVEKVDLKRVPRVKKYIKKPPASKLQEDELGINSINLNGKEFHPNGELGAGVDGKVVLFKSAQNNDEMAVKVSKFTEPFFDVQGPFEEEAHFLRRNGMLNGKLTKTSRGEVVIPMKMVKGQPYDKFFDNTIRQATPEELSKQVNAIENAIKTQLEEKGIEHRDLHLGNIMYDKETNKATIIDFGRSASSLVTDENGKEINLNVYGDRIRFLTEMIGEIKHIDNSHKFTNVIKSIEEKLKEAKSKNSNDENQLRKVNALFDSKDKKLVQLKDQMIKIKTKLVAKSTASKKDWMDFKAKAKEMKKLIRELQILQNYKTMEGLGFRGNQHAIHDRTRSELDKRNPQLITQDNLGFNHALQNAHNDFQMAKKNIQLLSESESESEPKQETNKVSNSKTKLDKLADKIGKSRVGQWVNNKIN